MTKENIANIIQEIIFNVHDLKRSVRFSTHPLDIENMTEYKQLKINLDKFTEWLNKIHKIPGVFDC